MSKIFISHSSRDAELAKGMITWLKANGFEEVFLDFDKHSGIAVGDDWERRLYSEIERCHAVIIVATPNWHTSKWC
jgi:TIR domain